MMAVGDLTPPPSAPHPPRARSPRVRRTISAPPGKLGLMVANTRGHGPAVHSIRPGSPVEGSIFRNDIIAEVNGVDTRSYTAEQITRVMKDTSGEERQITVLSARR